MHVLNIFEIYVNFVEGEKRCGCLTASAAYLSELIVRYRLLSCPENELKNRSPQEIIPEVMLW